MRLITLSLTSLLLACGAPATPAPEVAAATISLSTAPEAKAEPAPVPEVAVEPEVAQTPEPAPTPEPAAEDDAIKTFVAGWVAAQNAGDFEAYAKHYADRFTGIKRAGPRTRSFGREGWLADRQRMFKSKMEVSAADIVVSTSARAVSVTFVQTWAAGTFQDKGPKLLVLVPSAAGLRIAREEMLASEIVAGETPAKAIAPADFMFALALPGGAGVVLPIESWSASAESGAPELLSRKNPVTVRRALMPSDDLKVWLGRKVAVYDARGSRCEGTIDSIDLVGRFVPHFGEVQGWDGIHDDSPRMSEVEVAASVWASEIVDKKVVARVPACTAEGVSFARDAAQPGPAFFTAGTSPWAERALAEARQLPGWKAIAKSAKDYPGVDAQAWDTYDGARPKVSVWQLGERTIVQVVSAAGNGCGAFGEAFGAIFEVKSDALVLLTDPEGGPTQTLEGVVDLDGDGELELLIDDGLIQKTGPIWRATRDNAPPDFDCPC